MPAQPTVLLMDDDQDFLDLYREMLSQHLPSMPEVRVANSGARALSILESDPVNLLIADLNLPKMDGLQVLTIARRKFPQLRLVVLTGIRDEQFRTRAYALGVDQFWLKPETDQEIGLLMESMEALLNQEGQEGFRGVQSKSLVDIIQLECLSQSSCVLKITNSLSEGRIYILSGEVVDAELPGGLTGEAAFQRILAWKTGSFETLPSDPSRVRTIFSSYQGLLLNTAQAIDEAASVEVQPPPGEPGDPAAVPARNNRAAALMSEVSQMEGVEFVLALEKEKKGRQEYWGLDDPKLITEFTKETLANFRSLGERLHVGDLQQIFGTGTEHKVVVAPCGPSDLCVGFPPSSSPDHVRNSVKTITTKWAS